MLVEKVELTIISPPNSLNQNYNFQILV